MTSARERPADRHGPRWDERSLLPDRAGTRWWVAVCLALVLTAAGVFVDLQRINRLGLAFQACYFLGCLLAVLVVQRKGLFGPMVQPPLILALTVPVMVLIAGAVPTGGATSAALAVGTPLINGFPTMAVTTGATLAVGFLRTYTQRPPAEESTPAPVHETDSDAAPDAEAARPSRRTQAEPARKNQAESTRKNQAESTRKNQAESTRKDQTDRKDQTESTRKKNQAEPARKNQAEPARRRPAPTRKTPAPARRGGGEPGASRQPSVPAPEAAAEPMTEPVSRITDQAPADPAEIPDDQTRRPDRRRRRPRPSSSGTSG